MVFVTPPADWFCAVMLFFRTGLRPKEKGKGKGALPTTGRGCGGGGLIACVILFWWYRMLSCVRNTISARANKRGRSLWLMSPVPVPGLAWGGYNLSRSSPAPWNVAGKWWGNQDATQRNGEVSPRRTHGVQYNEIKRPSISNPTRARRTSSEGVSENYPPMMNNRFLASGSSTSMGLHKFLATRPE